MALFRTSEGAENDPERAARPGLAILRALEELNAGNGGRGLPALAARIGVDSTGDVFGDAPNLAARVESAKAVRLEDGSGLARGSDSAIATPNLPPFRRFDTSLINPRGTLYSDIV
jgi:class 3 adenylate cyclase